MFMNSDCLFAGVRQQQRKSSVTNMATIMNGMDMPMRNSTAARVN
jgi:hypothetical protein